MSAHVLGSRPRNECFHRITQFQAHRHCHLPASICENECQQLHSSSAKDEVLLITLETVQEQHGRMLSLIRTELNSYCDKMKHIYNQILAEIHKLQSHSLREMERELHGELTRCLALESTLFQKLENKRYERIKCFELMSLLEEAKPQQKIKKGALPEIFEKYRSQTNVFRECLFAGRPIPKEFRPDATTKANRTPQRVARASQTQKAQAGQREKGKASSLSLEGNSTLFSNNRSLVLLEQKKKECKELEDKYEQLKYQRKKLATEKSNLERELSKVQLFKGNARNRKLGFRTWDIAQVITKKIKKPKREALPETAHKTAPRVIQIEDEESPLARAQRIAQSGSAHIPEAAEQPQQMNASLGQRQERDGARNADPEGRQNSNLHVEPMQEQEQDFFDYLRKRKLV